MGIDLFTMALKRAEILLEETFFEFSALQVRDRAARENGGATVEAGQIRQNSEPNRLVAISNTFHCIPPSLWAAGDSVIPGGEPLATMRITSTMTIR